MDLARALDIPDDVLVSASIGESDARAFAISDGVLQGEQPGPDPWEPGDPVLLGSPAQLTDVQATAADDVLPFPSRGEDFLVMSTGDASHAMRPNTEGSLTTILDGLNNEQGNDMAQLELVLHAPKGARCLGLDVAFFSEEYPEYVGSSFNDAFTAQLYTSEQQIVNGAVVAENNIAQDSGGNPLTVNAAFDLVTSRTTTYDGGTPRLRASGPVLSDREVTVYLTIQDLGDSSLDSAAFIDNLFFSTDELCRFGSAEDSDGDGLLDEWETHGFTMTVDGEQHFVDLPAMGAHPRRKDVFVEIDYMVGDTHDHKPQPDAIAMVVDAFASSGVQLHVDYGRHAPLTYGPDGGTWGDLSQANSIPHSEYLGGRGLFSNSYSWRAFDDVKRENFDLARAALFHYNVWAHHMEKTENDQKDKTSGRSRGALEGGSDFIVSLGDWTNTKDQQAGTFMHELGHNLGLGHGGDDHLNYKPNYISVMNYDFQFGMLTDYPGPKVDYSFVQLPALDEGDLDEHAGIGVTADLGMDTRYRCPGASSYTETKSQPIDWDCDGTIESSVATSITQDSRLSVLNGHNDWRNLVFTGGAIGMPGAIEELPEETVDPEPEVDYDTYLELVGGAPEAGSAPQVPGGPFMPGDEVTVSVPFDVSSGDGGNMVAEWSWGDGSTSVGTVTAGEPPVAAGAHVYAAPGTYEVTVSITGPDGASTSPPTSVTVGSPASSSGSATAVGWLRAPATSAHPAGRVTVAIDARVMRNRTAPVGASLVVHADARLVVAGAHVERITVTGRTAVVESRVTVNGRPGYRQRATLVDGLPSRVRIQVWDPARGGPDDAAALVLDTAPGGQAAPAPTVLVDVRT